MLEIGCGEAAAKHRRGFFVPDRKVIGANGLVKEYVYGARSAPYDLVQLPILGSTLLRVGSIICTDHGFVSLPGGIA